ncbi:MAG: hypothetical protein ABF760_03815 [Zymomonas mobilis]|uniref:Uncharacterized protein n=1 Tax=Zymomonas mobilis TaxID=542 RepID=A0A542W2G0_ZYMMB|nr:hypothetical protein [Zymomonas mobilis]TQL17669.1 hypothetical protein FBY58_1267 [Zymomonas mobilis]
MNFSPLALVLSLTLASGTPQISHGKPDNQINPYSTNLVLQAEKSQKEGHLVDASQLLESALAVDPRNKNAFMALGHIAAVQCLNGKAIRFYQEALNIDPTDVNSLAAQGEAMVAKGAIARAQQNLDKIKKICGQECPASTQLTAAIAKGAPPAHEVKTADNDNSIKTDTDASKTATPVKSTSEPSATPAKSIEK